MEISVKNKLDSLFYHTAALCCRRYKAAIIAEPNLTFGPRFLRH